MSGHFSFVRHTLEQYVPVSDDVIQAFITHSTLRSARRNEWLVHDGESRAELMFITKGLLMTYLPNEYDEPHVLQFGKPTWWTGDLEAFFRGGKSVYSVKCMTNAEVRSFTLNQFEALCNTHEVFNRYFRMIFQNSLVTHQKRLMRNITEPAKKRYMQFSEKYPEVSQQVPLKYIASYLGITPEFLSKIRRSLQD